MTLPYNTCFELPDKLQFIKMKRKARSCERALVHIG